MRACSQTKATPALDYNTGSSSSVSVNPSSGPRPQHEQNLWQDAFFLSNFKQQKFSRKYQHPVRDCKFFDTRINAQTVVIFTSSGSTSMKLSLLPGILILSNIVASLTRKSQKNNFETMLNPNFPRGKHPDNLMPLKCSPSIGSKPNEKLHKYLADP